MDVTRALRYENRQTASSAFLCLSASIMLNEFLRFLKPFRDAGFINLLGAIALYGVVIAALLPQFLRWRRRPKLHVAIPGNYFAPRQNFSTGNIAVYTLSAPFILRNAGLSPASNLRAVATDFYKFLPSPKNTCDHVRSSQKVLEGSNIDLPPGLSAPVLLCSFTSAGRYKSGFVIGRTIKCEFAFPNAESGVPSGGAVKFSPPPDLDSGTYVARVVVSGSNVLPTSTLVIMQLGSEVNSEVGEEIKLGIANRRERRAVKVADRRREKFRVSRG
jgi:hypothetical protein